MRKTKKKQDCFYGGDAYAEVGTTSSSTKTLGQKLSIQEAKKLRDALTKAIVRCELSLDEPILPPLNFIILTTHKRNGQITVLAKKRLKPLKRGCRSKT